MFPISILQVVLAISKQAKLLSLISITPLVCCSFLANSVKVLGQPTPDNTLPNNTLVLPNGNLIDIKGGTIPQNGANLFHSFDNFSVESNNTVRFIHNSGIENIINRVTGGSISNINGTIQTLIDGTTNKGNANIFIINPNGIIFGADAKLDIGGSFFASTADSIKFTDGSFYSAVNPQEPPLLTINVPLGLQFNNSNSGDIVVKGNGNKLFFDQNTFATVRDNRPAGLQVPEGKTLALVGGNVNLQGGNLTAEQGRVELGSVLGVGLVTLNSTTSTSTTSDWNLDYAQVSNFQDINLTSAASIDVSGNGGGEVQAIGRNISLVDGSAILSKTTGNSSGRTLNITAKETLKVIGVSQDLSTSILNDVDFESSGNAGKIAIDTKNLIVADGGQITSNTSGDGNGGIVDVTAENIQLTGGFFGPSGIFADANFSTGNGGSIVVKTDNLLIEGGAAIASRSQTFSDGKAGSVNITAKDIQLVGTAFGQFPSLLSTSSFSPNADGGKIKVKTNTLKLVDGAQIESTTFKSGNAGTLDIQAKQIDILGASTTGSPSGIFAEVREQATGNGGLINIETQGLQLKDGGQISTNALGFGNGGNLEVKAEDIVVSGFINNFPSGLLSSTNSKQGGNVNIETMNLLITQGGQVQALTF
ncbi:MAG: filamentous hemagglutinin N-terminal domain-containing protein, partial [Cyanobacteria bacterium J06635_10]